MKSKILIALIFIAEIILMTGCAAYAPLGTNYKYKYGLIKIENQSSMIDSSSVMKFSDDKIDVSFTVESKSIAFTMKNKTSNAMKIVWDESAIVLFDKSYKIMHNGIKYTDSNASQTPTIIPPQASIEDLALPSENVYYKSGYYGTYFSSPGGWQERDILPTCDMNNKELKSAIIGSKGQKFRLYLTVQYSGQSLEYDFNFIITDIKPILKEKTSSAFQQSNDSMY